MSNSDTAKSSKAAGQNPTALLGQISWALFTARAAIPSRKGSHVIRYGDL